MDKNIEAEVTIQEGEERSPRKILADLRDNFPEICRKKKAVGEPEEQIMKNWCAGVRICLALLEEDRLIPEGLIQETNDFLKASLSPKFKPAIEEKDRADELIDKVLGRKPAEVS